MREGLSDRLEDWIEHTGSIMPRSLSLSVPVIVRRRDGTETQMPRYAQFINWQTTGKNQRDITHYKIAAR